MVKLNKIYTRTGDSGDTGLVGGTRIAKFSLRVEAYGVVDEANALIGIARLHTQEHREADAMLMRIQHDLFDCGADLSTLYSESQEALRIIPAQVERLEKEIDTLNDSLSALNSFVLPGGSAASVHLHHARTVVRRAERIAFAVAETEEVNVHLLHYLNRLSDFLFVLARYLNDKGAGDVLWKPGMTR
jgi:cob(I)alamin adenosyltransferase